MRDRPNSAELLEIARTRLMEELLPALPAENKYSALMIAAAMAIAMRELENGDTAETEEQFMLGELLGADVSGDASLLDLNRRFAAGLRAGEFESSKSDQDMVHRLLRHVTLSKLGESNPKYLAKAD
ncbi:MAG: hypothetical protein HQ514_01250 [Rhodospirillales bacterium]|nr:hypothetical protein [Rhodospirillales bacterium]